MGYMILGGHLDIEEHKKKTIRKAGDTQTKEKHFKLIAEELLPSEGFGQIWSPKLSQGVPFDFIATREQKLALIENC